MSSLTESSLGLSLGSEASGSSPAKSVSSDSSQRTAHYSGMELSLPTQRRLIRKPLPNVPSLGARAEAAQQHRADLPPSPSYPFVPGEQLGLLAEQWWPPFDTLPEMSRQDSQSDQPLHQESDLLDDVSQAHLHALLRCALQSDDIPLPACYHTAIYDAVLAALRTLAEDKTLSGLQRTACILWRAEAQMKMLNPSSPEPTASSRWARLGWPAAAFRGMVQMQSGPSSSGPAQALEASLAESQPHKLSKEQKVRKRDVALAILSNAVWLVGTRRSDIANRAGRAGKRSHRGAKSQQRATQIEKREPPFKRGALPNFIAPSAPTTAISTNPSPSLSTTNSSSTSVDTSPRSSSPASASHSTPTLAHRDPSPAPAPSAGDARVPTPSSRAMEQLASLNAAAGAALQAQARLSSRERHGDNLEGHRSVDAPSRSSSMSSRPQTDAEILETAALEKAEREFIARVGEDCEERAKMVIATVMVDVRLDGASPPRRRSGQGSAPDEPGHPTEGGDQGNGSAISSRTDRTISTITAGRSGGPDAPSTLEPSPEQPVCWLPGTFRGSKLFTDPFKDQGEKARKDSERIKRAGGTFAVKAQTKEEGELITETLAVALFTAAAMLLESAMLRDVGYARPQPPRSRSQNNSTSEDAEKGNNSSGATDEAHKSEHANGEEPGTPKSAKQARRWTKGFWGMLQSSSDAVSAALSGAIKNEHPDGTRTRTLSLARTSTEDGSMRSRMSAAVARSYGRESGSSSARKLPARFGRLFKETGDANGHGGVNGSLKEEEGHEDEEPRSSREGLPAPAPPLGHKVSQSLPALSMATEFLPRPAPPPLSTSPEISADLRQASEIVRNDNLRGPQYLRAFAAMQTLAVLVGGQGQGTSASLATPKPNGGYFGSLSSATSAVRSFSITSTLSHIEDPAGTDAPPPTPGTPLLTPGGPARVGQIPASRLKREEVACYQQAGAGRDIHLGHVIEDMCSRAETLELEREMKAAATPAASGKPTRNPAEALPLTVYYLHNGHRITIATQTLPKPQNGLSEEAAAATLKAFGGASGDADDEDEGDTDIAAVATTLHADRDAARTAVALAEEAIHAAENEGGRPKSSNEVWLWSANARTGHQTKPKPISGATWLVSFAKFLEALIYHPGMITMEGEEPADRYDIVRLFKKEGTLVKVSLQPLTVYPLEVEGPTVRKRKRSEPRPDAEETGTPHEDEMLEETRLEIQRFYGSVKEHIADLQRICVERSLDENGMTIKSPATRPETGAELADSGEDADLDSILTSEVDQSPVALLNRLKSGFRTDEFALYDALKETSRE